MSARTDAYRGDGLRFPVFCPAGHFGPVVLPADLRLGTVLVKTGGTAPTVDVKVNGVSVLAQSNHPSGALAANATVEFDFSLRVVIPKGATLEFTTTDAGAVASLAFFRA